VFDDGATATDLIQEFEAWIAALEVVEIKKAHVT